MRRNSIAFWVAVALFLVAIFLMTQVVSNEYPFFAGYVILQFIVLAVAWSILGGYAGYVNFGTNAFFGVGVYTAVFLAKATGALAGRADRRRRKRRRIARLRGGPVDLAHAGHLLLDRDDRDFDRDRDVGDELAICRRRGRHPDAAAAGDGHVSQLSADAVLRSGDARGAGDCDLALYPEAHGSAAACRRSGTTSLRPNAPGCRPCG